MSHFEVVDKTKDGEKYHLLRDDVKIFEGTASDCYIRALELGANHDTVTGGSNSVKQLIWRERWIDNERRMRCGLPSHFVSAIYPEDSYNAPMIVQG